LTGARESFWGDDEHESQNSPKADAADASRAPLSVPAARRRSRQEG